MQSGSKKVLQNLFKQKTCGTFCDVQFHHQGAILWGHACVLASCSPYFMDYLKQRIDEGDHWCARKPLVITLDNFVDDIKDICFICVSKIIDFMYLRELIVLKGHFQHFCKIANILKVLDLLPFCKKNVEEENLKHFHINKSLGNEKSKIPLNDEILKDLCNKKETADSSLKKVNGLELTSQECKIGESLAPTNIQNVKTKTDNVSIIDNFEDIKIKSSNKICEFLCCNPDLNLNISPGCEMKRRRKRKMFCESCKFSSISINKILKHVQSENHLGKYCPVCNLKSESIEHQNQHLKEHYHSQPFICHICQKRSRFWEYHKLHLRVHCRNKKFNCEICQRRFKYKQNLTIHLLNHKFVCNKCGHLSSDENSYQLHKRLHRNGETNLSSNTHELKDGISALNKQPNDLKQNKFEKVRKFQCYECSEKFTLKKNLSRHVQLKHYSAEEYKCPNCAYLTKRYDLLKDHMKRHHNCLPPDKTKPRKRNESSKIKHNQEYPNQNGIVGVLIPVELVSVDGSSKLNAFAVKAGGNEKPVIEESQLTNHNKGETGNTVNNDKLFKSQTNQSICKNLLNQGKENFQNLISEPEILVHVNIQESTDKHSSSEEIQKVHTNVEKDIIRKGGEIRSHFIDNSENIWLNEATGEFLSDSSFINIPKIDAEYSVDKNNCMNYRTEKSSVLSSDFEESFPSLILNEAASNLSSFELDDDNPQTNLMDLDNQDNLFPWESLGDNFCSTWVLNETTGELNMVSFGIQPLKNCNELKLDENTGAFSFADDDETALFLNEGTGDLSVIYFNPNKNYSDTSNYFINDQLNQEKMETMSQHSNDEDDWLNEEFLRASTDFMAQDENETFLNELTGEFDVTHYDNFNTDTHQLLGSECIYLNEETGEISHNVIDKNMNNDILSNTDPFSFDFDDSLNCEDFEQFSTEMSDFSSQFCLDNDNSNSWHNFDETSDTLLNECTGELVKRC